MHTHYHLRRYKRFGNFQWLLPSFYGLVTAVLIAFVLVLLPGYVNIGSDFPTQEVGGDFSAQQSGNFIPEQEPGSLSAHEETPPIVYEETTREPAVTEDDAFSNVSDHLREYWKAIRNTRYVTIIDYSKPSDVKRMSLIDLQTGKVEKYLVSHGKNSGWEYATSFSNRPESHRSCRGFFVTGKEYSGKHGVALQLVGLEKGVNDNALRRGIVIHGANYVSMRSVMLNRGRLGRSLGCPAIPVEVAESVISRIKDGSLVYIHASGGVGNSCESGGPSRPAKNRS